MSIKKKLLDVEARKRNLEAELQKIIEDKVFQFQKDNNVAVSDFMVFTREIPRTLSQSEIPPFCYVDEVKISIDREHFLLNSID